ncbi:hypothetical protein [Nitrolancea hollandica]|uniref:Secreted protein n=1 Tax=Nitrolancea hollandica Lb TaxID=1129897 RepID=I4EMG6_9BACT|nr:hypothetical protein [Nitrolancea hollandica]CCF85879.1 exported hypothetical protein [Nitrolancea hollandica Lb]
MKRRVLALLTAGLLTLSVAGGALAAQDQFPVPGSPNCHGRAISYLASNGLATPAEGAQLLGFDNAGQFNKLVKESCSES